VTTNQTIGFLQVGGTVAASRFGAKRSCADIFGPLHSELEFRNDSDGTRSGEAKEKRRSVYLACTSVRRFGRFWRFWPFVESITYVFSIRGDVPSPVVPAIHSKRVERISPQPERVQKGAFPHPFCTTFLQLKPFSRLPVHDFAALTLSGEIGFRGEYKVEYGCLRSVLRRRYRLRVDIQR